MKTILTSALLLLACQLMAMLPPAQQKSLREHLMDVNKEWASNLSTDQHYDELVSFSDDTYRIQKHLYEVCDLIESRNDQFDYPQQKQRSKLMRQLRAYADAARFPENLFHLERHPYFIDHKGTACAVGYLMLNNGFQEEALRVKKEMNYAYIKEIPESWLMGFVMHSGLSVDELALIQPGYPPATFWDDLNTDIEGRVNCFYDDGDEFIMAGLFSIDGTEANIASCDGQTVTAWSEVPQGEIMDLQRFNGKLYATGIFLGGVYDIAIFENNAWSYSNATFGKTAEGIDLQIFNDELYVATSASGFAGYDHMVKKWDENSSQWLDLGVFNDVVRKLHVYDNSLYVGGDFQTVFLNNNTIPLNYLASLDAGSWIDAGNGLSTGIYAFANYNNDLVISGKMMNGDNVAGVALTWQDGMWQGNQFSGEVIPPYTNSAINTMVVANGELYSGGDFYVSAGVTFGADVAHLSFEDFGGDITYTIMEPVFVNQGGSVRAMLYFNGDLYIGGDFLDPNNSLFGFARTDIVTSIEVNPSSSFNIYPNPVDRDMRIVLGDESTVSFTYNIFDMKGRSIRKGEAASRDEWLLLNDLNTGVYVIQVYGQNDEFLGASKFLKK